MKVLVLSLSTGQGHHQTADAIADYIKEQGSECKVLDVYKDISPLLSGSVEKGYLASTRHAPYLYGKVYRFAEKKDKPDKNFTPISIPNSIVSHKFSKIIGEFEPDVIVTTHVFTGLLLSHTSYKRERVTTIGVVTDFTLHPFWVNTDLDYYVTASHLLNHQCIKRGIDKEKILPFGIPIHKKFAAAMGKKQAREAIGIEDMSTIMIMMGSMGYGNVGKIVKDIDTLDLSFQLLCVCGKNERARRKISAMETKHKVYCYGYVDNVNIMMDASDFLVTKPGGLSISESLAKGLPVILLNPIPGQEDRNLEFLLNNGLAVTISETYPIDEAVYQLMSNQWRNQNWHNAVRYVGSPDSSKKLGDFILGLGNKDKKADGVR